MKKSSFPVWSFGTLSALIFRVIFRVIFLEIHVIFSHFGLQISSYSRFWA